MPRSDSREGVVPSYCPQCHSLNDAASEIGGDTNVYPTPGDFSICLRCGTILRYDHTLHLALVYETELAELNAEERTDLERAATLVRHALALRKHHNH